jgi:4-amino-4-deoxy-L-arabinose transferase-like glycosyltransferase
VKALTVMMAPGRGALHNAAWLVYAAALASSLPALRFHFVGEEGILAISSLEMHLRGDWLRLWLFGNDQRHGVFANWLIIAGSRLVGWEHVLAVTRAVMLLATAAAGGIAYLLVQRLYRDAALAAFAAALYVSFVDILFYRGWLGYRDPLFGMLAFAAIAGLWLAARERRFGWLGMALAALTLAFLTKGLIAYAYAGAAALVLLARGEARAFLLHPVSIALGVIALCLPFAWFHWIVGDTALGGRMASEMLAKLGAESAGAYALKLVAYPLETALRLAPASLLLGYWWHRQRGAASRVARDVEWRTALAIALVAFAPFWLAPQSHFRYLLPIVPLCAVAAAVAVRELGERHVRLTLRWLWAAIGLKLVVALAAFPWYQQAYRGANYGAAATDILARSAGHSLYTVNVSASGLSIAAHVDLARLPQPPLTLPPDEWRDGFVISYGPDTRLGRVVTLYRLGGTTVALLCRGAACAPALPRRTP